MKIEQNVNTAHATQRESVSNSINPSQFNRLKNDNNNNNVVPKINIPHKNDIYTSATITASPNAPNKINDSKAFNQIVNDKEVSYIYYLYHDCFNLILFLLISFFPLMLICFGFACNRLYYVLYLHSHNHNHNHNHTITLIILLLLPLMILIY